MLLKQFNSGLPVIELERYFLHNDDSSYKTAFRNLPPQKVLDSGSGDDYGLLAFWQHLGIWSPAKPALIKGRAPTDDESGSKKAEQRAGTSEKKLPGRK
ncbi:hypothetical protein J6590_024985 [Homalodisca vitripennis]|nr:hypothetical protein J6590_024985 [Homalodisca vitripennis]